MFNSDTEQNAIVAVMELKDSQNRPVIVAVHINKKAGFNQINKVASIYGKDDASVKFAEWTDKGLLRYLNNDKSHSLLTSFGLQSPTEKSMNGLLGNNVLLQTDIVNNQSENATRYSIRPNKKQSALEMMTSEKVNQNPDLLDRLSDGGYKQLKSNLKKEFDKGVAYIDEKVHDRLRPVVDWIKGFDIQGLSDLDKKRIVDTIYAAEGVKASD